jgi:hypothetical protein
MADSSPVIIERLDSGMLTRTPKTRPDVVFVLSYGDQRLRTFTRNPVLVERQGARYCYVIDASQRHTSGNLRVPARDDVFFFAVHYDATWRVTDPEQVVRANVTDADALVDGFLSRMMWPMGRAHYADDVAGAEADIVRGLRVPQDIGDGLTLLGVTVRMVLDQDQSSAAKDVFADAHAGRIERTRVDRLRQLVTGDEDLLMLHLAQHPSDTETILQMVTGARQRNDDVRLSLLDRMLQNGFVEEADIGPLRDSILGGGSGTGFRALPTSPAAPTSPPPAYRQPPSGLPPSRAHGYSDQEPAPSDEQAERESDRHAPTGNVSGWRPVGRSRPDRRNP